MSHRIRFAAVLLTMISLTVGSLNAFPVSPHRTVPAEEGAGVLTTIMDWLAFLFSGNRPEGESPKPTRAKIGSQLDPDGNH